MVTTSSNVYALESISSHAFSSYNVSILVFEMMTNKYNKTSNQSTYTLNSENVAQNFAWFALHFYPASICFSHCEIFSTQSTKSNENFECWTNECPRKMQKLKWNVHSSVFGCSGSHFPFWEKKLLIINREIPKKHLLPLILRSSCNFPPISNN